MRARSLWRESPKTSICVYCTNLNINIPLLHRSDKRHAHFGALSKPAGSTSIASRQTQPGFGAPTFGNASPAPSFPDKPTFGQPVVENHSIELTSEERRVKNVLAEAAEAEKRRKEAEQQRNAPRPRSTFRVDTTSRTQPKKLEDISKHPAEKRLNVRRIDKSFESPMVWNQLKKKGQPAKAQTPDPTQSPQPDHFQVAQARREAVANSGRFTPLRPPPARQPERSNDASGRTHLPTQVAPATEKPPVIRRTYLETPLTADSGIRKPLTRQLPISRTVSREPFAKTPLAAESDIRKPSTVQKPEPRVVNREPFARIQSAREVQAAPTKIDAPSAHASIEERVETTNTNDAKQEDVASAFNDRPNFVASRPERPKELTFEQRQKLYEEAEARRPTSKTQRKAYDEPKTKFSVEPERGRGKGGVRGGRDEYKARRREREALEYQRDDGEAAAAAAIRAEERRRKREEKAAKKAAALKTIFLPEYISVGNLASAVKAKPEQLLEKMLELGFEDAGMEHILNGENAGLIAQEYGFEPIVERASDDLVARPPPDDVSILPPRPPVVTIMGHVDHGKTTLLDYLRKSSVAASEHGGITQHIGAFSVSMPSGKIITFLDTPGHAAFLSMRQRGANVTDIVVLVVAADDSVKPQTIEAINHAKAARVPIVVAINKIDKPDANSERVKQDLARHGVDVEDFGGDVQAVEVSGKTGQGMGELEETVTTLSEVLDMRAEIDGPAEGWVLEASIKPMGKVATVLVRRGTMRPGDVIVAGNTWARIRVLRNEAGLEIESATPGTPVEIDGWKEQPVAGDEVLEAPSEAVAKEVVEHRMEKIERDRLAEDMEAVNDHRKQIEEARAEEKRKAELDEDEREAEEAAARGEKVDGVKQAYFIIKADVSGSIEAVVNSVSAIGNKEVVPNILRSGVGQLTEFDVEHAATAKGTLINFNTTIDPNIAGLAEKAKVTILDHNVIYRLVDDVKLKMSEYLAPLITQRVLGEAEIADIFNITIKGRQQKAIAGCKVRNGTVNKNSPVRVMRDGVKIFDGEISSLKNLKKDVLEMRRGTECGMGFEKWTDFQVGDQIQTYENKVEKRYL